MAEQDPKQSGVEEYAGEAGDVQGQGGEGRRNAEATPEVGTDGGQGQTSTPAPGGDVGVPPDEVLAAQTEAAKPDPLGEQGEPTLPADS